ncbi:MAG: carboxypeptidase regulatory-like domain-containing protein [Pseudomonadota bacterium]
MQSRQGAGLFIVSIILTALTFSIIPGYAATASYTCDNGNRLIRVDYEDGSKIEYAYDESGNRTVKTITAVDATFPVTTAAPPGGTYDAAQSVTLTCNDGTGSGCDKTYYTTDGSTPTPASPAYSSAIAIAATTTLKFFSTDLAGNAEAVKTETYTIGNPLQVTVRKDAQNVLSGVNVYLFNEAGSYLGQGKTTDALGQAVFAVAPGTYKIRADYLGYQFWSDPVQIVTSASAVVAIPHHTVNITVNGAYQGTPAPIAGINVYLFTPSGFYLGMNAQTASDGRVSFSLPEKEYKVRADDLGQQYFSAVFNAQDTTINIPMADAEITVTQGGQNVNGVNVYVFTATGAYLGIFGTTNASGKATFRLPAGVYKFRADYMGSRYWSAEETLTADQLKAVAINTGGGTFTLTVLKGVSDPLTAVNCYVFNEAGSYLGLSGATNSSGQVTFNLPDGSYKFRVDYLGYQHWTDVATVPAAMSMTKTIAHQNVAVTVTGALGSDVQPKQGVNVYLFTPAGSYLGISAMTDADGRVTFNLPQQSYKVRADYLTTQQFWSNAFTWEDTSVVIPEGTARVHVTMAGQDVQNVPVYVFTSGGSYLGLTGTTDAAGIKEFRLPAGDYKFRADYQGSQYWATATINQDVTNAVELSAGGGTFTLTVLKGASDPLTAVNCYVFNEAGSYLGLSGATNSSGQVIFGLANGSYKFRVDYLGYQFWTDLYTVPTTLTGSLTIPHQDSTITVEGVYQGSQPITGVNVYLFTPAGSYLGKTQVTNVSGQVTFNLPNKAYKVRADYLGSQYWSAEFQFANATVSIQRGMAQITARKAGNPVNNAPVYVFSESGSYLGLSAATNIEGKAEFVLPAKSYKFRVDEGGSQHWSAVTAITAGQVNPVEVNWD